MSESSESSCCGVQLSQINWLGVSRLIGLSLVLLIVNITEGVAYGTRYSINTLAAGSSVFSILIGTVGVFEPVTRLVVHRLGFIALEWIQVFELVVVSAQCTTMSILASVWTNNTAYSVALAVALTTALLVRVDLSITARVAGQIYVENLLQAANENSFARSHLGRSLTLRQSDASFGSMRLLLGSPDSLSNINPPHVSTLSVLFVHIIAAILLPAPLIGLLIAIPLSNRTIGAASGEVVGVMVLTWIRVLHSFFSVRHQVRSIQLSNEDDEANIKDIITSFKKETENGAAAESADAANPFGGMAGVRVDATSSDPFQPFGSLTRTVHDPFSSSSTPPTRAAMSKGALTALVTTVSTTQAFRSKALSIRCKTAITEIVQQKKPSYKKGMVIGRGAFSTVYACMNNHTGEIMAAKKISFPADNERTEQRIAMLQNEVALLRSIEHPHMVKYLFCDQPESEHGVEATDGDIVEFYIFMEYVGGGSIKDIVKHFGPLSEEAAASFIAQVLLGLSYLHKSGRVHRDIKPANILCRSDGHVKLSDFGTAADLSDAQNREDAAAFAGIVGTPLFSPPEVIREVSCVEADALSRAVSADIWAVGCTLLEMLTGKRPWSHLSSTPLRSLEIMLAEADSVERALSKDEWQQESTVIKLIPTLPDELSPMARSFLECCLCFDPMQRHNADALLYHPWIAQFGLVDTHENVLKELIPLTITGGATALANHPELLHRLASMPPSVPDAASGVPKDLALPSDQAEYLKAKERQVMMNLGKLVHKTRALMRLGAFRAHQATGSNLDATVTSEV